MMKPSTFHQITTDYPKTTQPIYVGQVKARSMNLSIKLSVIVVLMLLVKIAGAQEQPNRQAQPAKSYTIENCINKFDSAKTVKTSVGYQYWFVPQNFLADGQTVKMSVVAPRQATHAAHKHEGDEIFFVLEGTAKFYLDGKTTTGGAYATFYCPEGSEHGISNAGDTELKYLVIRKYPVK